MIVELNCKCNYKVTGKHSWLHGSLVWPNSIAQEHHRYFTAKVKQLLIKSTITAKLLPQMICNMQ